MKSLTFLLVTSQWPCNSSLPSSWKMSSQKQNKTNRLHENRVLLPLIPSPFWNLTISDSQNSSKPSFELHYFCAIFVPSLLTYPSLITFPICYSSEPDLIKHFLLSHWAPLSFSPTIHLPAAPCSPSSSVFYIQNFLKSSIVPNILYSPIVSLFSWPLWSSFHL